MSTTDQVAIPSQTLAEQIIKRLVDEGLLSAEAGARLQPQLADGSLRAEDWRLPIELGVQKERNQ